jgi:hypothetical protein
MHGHHLIGCALDTIVISIFVSLNSVERQRRVYLTLSYIFIGRLEQQISVENLWIQIDVSNLQSCYCRLRIAQLCDVIPERMCRDAKYRNTDVVFPHLKTERNSCVPFVVSCALCENYDAVMSYNRCGSPAFRDCFFQLLYKAELWR